MAFTVEPEDSESEILGKVVSDLQENIQVGFDFIKGTLKYVTGYTGYSSNPKYQEGNFMVLKVDNVPDGATMIVEVVGGVAGPVTLDEDLNFVARLTDPWRQTIKVTCRLNGEESSKEFSLGGMTFETED